MRLSVAASILLLTACATPDISIEELPKESLQQERNIQFQQAFKYQSDLNKRLAEVARPLLKNAVDDCGKRTRYSTGIFLHKSSEYPKEQLTATTELYGKSEYVQVLNVLDSGPSKDKLFPGDQIKTINQENITDNTTAHAIKQLNTAMVKGADIELQLIRQGESLTVTISPELICDYAVVLSASDAVNGYADGSQIIITAGLMRFLQKDEQLAFIIAHELAHNTLNHIPKKLNNGTIGTAIDLILAGAGFPSPLIATGIGANLYSQSFETEADLEALRLMQNAGYPIQGIDEVWRQMARLHPSTITHGQSISHPTTAERAIRIRSKIQQLIQQDQIER
jgi:hypothetical protein